MGESSVSFWTRPNVVSRDPAWFVIALVHRSLSSAFVKTTADREAMADKERRRKRIQAFLTGIKGIQGIGRTCNGVSGCRRVVERAQAKG